MVRIVNGKLNKGELQMKISTEVLYTNGTVDLDATTDSFVSALEALQASDATKLATVGPAVEKYFDANPGLRSPLPTIASLVTASMAVDHTAFASTSEAVADYIRSNANGNGRDSFVIGKGRANGGCARK
jgi:hypothetical protein